MDNTVRYVAVSAAHGRFYYGWVIVAVAALCMFCSGPGQSYTFSVFLEPIERDLGISKAAIASAYAIATLVSASLLPRMGKLLDHLGPRHTLMLVSCLLGFACVMFGAAANFLWLSFGFALLRFMGQGATMMATTNLVSQWFAQRRGIAMSLLALGFAASMAMHPPFGSFLIDRVGWRMAWAVLGVMTWVTMLIPLFFLVFDKPEHVSLPIDGDDTIESAGDGELPGLTLMQAKRERAFYLLCGVWFVVGGLVTVLHFFQVSVLIDRGLDRSMAARMFPISALSMVVSMPFVGRLLDTVRTRYVIAVSMLLIAAALVSITMVSGFYTGVVYAVIFGLTNAFMMTMFGYLWPRYFGRAHLGSIQGMGQMFGVVGASIAPIPVGLAIEMFGSADRTLHVLAAFAVATAVVVMVSLRTPAGLNVPAELD